MGRVIVRGVEYKNLWEAGYACGVPYDTIAQWITIGLSLGQIISRIEGYKPEEWTTDMNSVIRKWQWPMKVFGKSYPNAASLAKRAGMSESTLRKLMAKSRDSKQLERAIYNYKADRRKRESIPAKLFGRTYKNYKTASSQFNIPASTMQGWWETLDEQEIERRILERKKKVERQRVVKDSKKPITLLGETYINTAEAAAELGVQRSWLSALVNTGHSITDIEARVVKLQAKKAAGESYGRKTIELFGVQYESLKAAAEAFKIPYATMIVWVKDGKTEQQIEYKIIERSGVGEKY